MATLDYTDDDEVDAPQGDPILTWNWATWPANLRRAMMITLGVILGVIAIVALVRWADQDLARKLKAQNAVQLAAQKKLQNSDQERRDIETNLPLLRQLEAAGIFGDEKRLEWIEMLRAIEKRWPGVRIQYAISAQSLQNQTVISGAADIATELGLQNIERSKIGMPAIPLPNGDAAKNFGVFNTDMKLTLNLLHEGDALAIIEELKAAELGRFTIRSCSFKRLSAENANGAVAATFGRPVDAECNLTWISMRAYAPT